MKILGIETSCDETAVCVLEAEGSLASPSFKVLGNALYSQVKVHEKYGGVFPMMAKREHARNLVPMLLEALGQANMKSEKPEGSEKREIGEAMKENLKRLLEREPELFTALIEHVASLKRPLIDAIAVTQGPGLEPALWVGVNFAKALSLLWNIPLLPVNHMEGHVVSILFKEEENAGKPVEFPAIALLISGGHTQLVFVEDWGKYEIIGDTRDDAVGEAFDKVARMLGLLYPGGPEISRLADEDRRINSKSQWKLPRPMINTDDFDFSFSGLKTAVLYTIKKLPKLSDEDRRGIAREFEDAVTDVLVAKTRKAIEAHNARTLIVGGGVTANSHIRERMVEMANDFANVDTYLPAPRLSTDNAVMIAMAGYVGYAQLEKGEARATRDFRAEGNLKLS